MSVKLLVKQRNEAGSASKEFILEDAVITLGRDKSCHVVLPEQAVSRNHAQISRDGALFFVEDLGSAYGTQINGKKLPKGEKRLLRNGDVIAIAQFDVTFDRSQELKPSSEKTSFVARQVIKDVMKGLGGEGPFFRIMNGPKEGTRIEINNAQELVVGRDATADIIFDQDDLISRRHAKIRRDWSGTHVEDLGSRNGIKVNKKRVQQKTLRDREELQIGGTRLLYLDPSEIRDDLDEKGDDGQMTEPPQRIAPPAELPAPVAVEASAVQPGDAPKPTAFEAPAASAEPAPVADAPPEEPPGGAPAADAEPPAHDDDELSSVAPAPMSPKVRMILIGAMGLLALIALVVIIAVLVGA